MKKIFCVTAHLPADGSSIPRVFSVKHLEETGYPVQVQIESNISDFDMHWADVVMIHRAVDETHLNIAKMAKQMGKKLWIDVDDDHLAMPIDHPVYLEYNREDRKTWIREATALADLVTISNPQILESYRSINKNIHYYPCAYDERLMPEPDYSPRNKVVLWRGSPTHRKSIAEFAPAIAKLDKQFKGWEFIFIGDYPWQMLEGITQNAWYSGNFKTVQGLWDYSRKVKPAIQMVCLTDNQFTRSRSNMSMIDATIAGAVTVARDWSHFQTPGVFTYKDQVEFVDEMSMLMDTVSDNIGQHGNVSQAWNYIQKHQTFKAINVKQMELINAFFTY